MHKQYFCNQPQNIIARIVAVCIVKILEVINIHHGKRISAPEPFQLLIHCPAIVQTGKLVYVRAVPVNPVQSVQKNYSAEEKADIPQKTVKRNKCRKHEKN